MSETIVDCLEKKAKVKFVEQNLIMSEALRDDIIKDCGHSKLKAKCLDLITKLRVEAKVLNPSKTARAPQPPDNFETQASLKKPELGLDDNGQIKLGHGVEDIKEMVEKGMIKTYGKRTKDGLNGSWRDNQSN